MFYFCITKTLKNQGNKQLFYYKFNSTNRYKTENYDAAKVPVAVDPTKDAYLSQYADSYMYTGNQNPFTGNGHVPEAPELLAKGGSQKVSEGIIVRIDPDGTEIPVAVKTKNSETFEIIK